MEVAKIIIAALKLAVDIVNLGYRYYSDKKQAATTRNSDGSVTE